MKLLSVLTRLSLIGLILYGGYRVFAEQRIVRVCEMEVKSIEKSLEERLDSNSPTIDFRKLSSDPLFFSWLYHVPPDKSFSIQMVTKESSELAYETLLRIPSQPKGHYGTIDIQFNSDGQSQIKQLEIYGPNFLKAQLTPDEASQYKTPRFLGTAISNKADLFKTVQARTSRPYFLAMERVNNVTKTIHLENGDNLALCYFTEEEDAGLTLKQHVIRVLADE